MNKLIYEVTKRLPSNKNSIKEVEPLIYKLREKITIPDEKFFNILIALTEAVNNAIIHGNNNDETKICIISIKATADNLDIEVEDQGNGFDYTNIKDPREPENLLKEGGRGVFLIKELSDFVSFTDMGRKIHIRFSLS